MRYKFHFEMFYHGNVTLTYMKRQWSGTDTIVFHILRMISNGKDHKYQGRRQV